VVSAIGNDGPIQGSIENPGDLVSVIGVGSLTQSLEDITSFSSRGMSKRALLKGVGFAKPDVLLPGENIVGMSLNPAKCDTKQGTSFSVPVLIGGIALALSALDAKVGKVERRRMQNTALVR
jgi:subtilisin family serine protease